MRFDSVTLARALISFMQSQETSRRVLVSRDGRLAALGLLAAYLLNVSARRV